MYKHNSGDDSVNGSPFRNTLLDDGSAALRKHYYAHFQAKYTGIDDLSLRVHWIPGFSTGVASLDFPAVLYENSIRAIQEADTKTMDGWMALMGFWYM